MEHPIRIKKKMCFQDLPAVLLFRTGTFLKPGEALQAARVCKEDKRLLAIVDSVNNARIGLGHDEEEKIIECCQAQAKALAMYAWCLTSLEVEEVPPQTIEPLLREKAGRMIKRLSIYSTTKSHALEWARLIALYLPSLEVLVIYFALEGEVSSEGPLKSLIHSLPPTLLALHLFFITAETLKSLVTHMACDGLPALQQLHMKYVNVDHREDAEYIGSALRTPSAARNLKSLAISISSPIKGHSRLLLSSMLSLFMEQLPAGAFPVLNTLVTDEIRWDLLGDRLIKVTVQRCTRHVPFWYDTDTHTLRLWFEAIRCRGLQALGDNGHLHFSENREGGLTLINELLHGLSQPLHPNAMTCIHILDLGEVLLDDEVCQSLARAILSKNFRTVKLLKLHFHHSCSVLGYSILGRVLHHDLIPLRGLSFIQVNCDVLRKGLHGLRCWCAFFESIPTNGLNNLERLTVDSAAPGCVGLLFHALSTVESPAIFHDLTYVGLNGRVGAGDVCALSLALRAEAFPRLEMWAVMRDTYYEALRANPTGVAIFFETLSRHTKIRQLGLGILYPPEEPSFLIGLNICFDFLKSCATSFSSLESVQFAYYQLVQSDAWQEEVIAHCRETMCAGVAPVNLKTLVFNGKSFFLAHRFAS